MKERCFNNKGFTLIEIIVVLVIMAILMSIAMPSVFGYTQKGQETAATSECRSVVTAAIQELSDKYIRTGNREFDSDVINKALKLSNVEGYIQNQKIGSDELIEYLEYVHPSGIVVVYENGSYRVAGDGEVTITPNPGNPDNSKPNEPDDSTPDTPGDSKPDVPDNSTPDTPDNTNPDTPGDDVDTPEDNNPNPAPNEPETSAPTPPVVEEKPTVTETTTEITSSVVIFDEDKNDPFIILPNKSWQEFKDAIIYGVENKCPPYYLPFEEDYVFYDNGKLFLIVYGWGVSNTHYTSGVFDKNTSLEDFLDKSGAPDINYSIIDKNTKLYNRANYPSSESIDENETNEKINPTLYKDDLLYDNGKLYVIITSTVQMKYAQGDWARRELPIKVITNDDI